MGETRGPLKLKMNDISAVLFVCQERGSDIKISPSGAPLRIILFSSGGHLFLSRG